MASMLGTSVNKYVVRLLQWIALEPLALKLHASNGASSFQRRNFVRYCVNITLGIFRKLDSTSFYEFDFHHKVDHGCTGMTWDKHKMQNGSMWFLCSFLSGFYILQSLRLCWTASLPALLRYGMPPAKVGCFIRSAGSSMNFWGSCGILLSLGLIFCGWTGRQAFIAPAISGIVLLMALAYHVYLGSFGSTATFNVVYNFAFIFAVIAFVVACDEYTSEYVLLGKYVCPLFSCISSVGVFIMHCILYRVCLYSCGYKGVRKYYYWLCMSGLVQQFDYSMKIKVAGSHVAWFFMGIELSLPIFPLIHWIVEMFGKCRHLDVEYWKLYYQLLSMCLVTLLGVCMWIANIYFNWDNGICFSPTSADKDATASLIRCLSPFFMGLIGTGCIFWLYPSIFPFMVCPTSDVNTIQKILVLLRIGGALIPFGLSDIHVIWSLIACPLDDVKPKTKFDCWNNMRKQYHFIWIIIIILIIVFCVMVRYVHYPRGFIARNLMRSGWPAFYGLLYFFLSQLLKVFGLNGCYANAIGPMFVAEIKGALKNEASVSISDGAVTLEDVAFGTYRRLSLDFGGRSLKPGGALKFKCDSLVVFTEQLKGTATVPCPSAYASCCVSCITLISTNMELVGEGRVSRDFNGPLRYLKISNLQINGLKSAGVDIAMKWGDTCGISASEDGGLDLGGTKLSIYNSSGTISGYATLGTGSQLTINDSGTFMASLKFVEVCIQYEGGANDISNFSFGGSTKIIVSNNPCADSIKTSIITNGGPFKNKSVALTVIPAKLLSSNVELIPGTTSSSAANGEFTRYSRLMYIGITGIKIDGVLVNRLAGLDITMKWRDECGISASKDETFDLGGKRFTISDSSGAISGYAILGPGTKMKVGSNGAKEYHLSLPALKFIEVYMSYTGCLSDTSSVKFQLPSSVTVKISNNPCADSVKTSLIKNGVYVKNKSVALTVIPAKLLSSNVELIPGTTSSSAANGEFTRYSRLMYIGITGIKIDGLKPDDADITMKWRDECGISASKDDTFDLGGKRFTISNSSGTISGYAILTSGAKLVAGSDKLSLRGFKFIRVRMHYTGCVRDKSSVSIRGYVNIIISNHPSADSIRKYDIKGSFTVKHYSVLFTSIHVKFASSNFELVTSEPNDSHSTPSLISLEIKSLKITTSNSTNGVDISMQWKDECGSGISASKDDMFDLGGKKFTISNTCGTISGYAMLDTNAKLKLENENFSLKGFKFTDISMNYTGNVTKLSNIKISNSSGVVVNLLFEVFIGSTKTCIKTEMKTTVNIREGTNSLNVTAMFSSSRLELDGMGLNSIYRDGKGSGVQFKKEEPLRYIEISGVRVTGLDGSNPLPFTMRWREQSKSGIFVSDCNENEFNVGRRRFSIFDSSPKLSGYGILGESAKLKFTTNYSHVTLQSFKFSDLRVTYNGDVPNISEVSIQPTRQKAVIKLSHYSCVDNNTFQTKHDEVGIRGGKLTYTSARLNSTNFELLDNGHEVSHRTLTLISLEIGGLVITASDNSNGVDITMKWYKQPCYPGIYGSSSKNELSLANQKLVITGANGNISGYAILGENAKVKLDKEMIFFTSFAFDDICINYDGCVMHPANLKISGSSDVLVRIFYEIVSGDFKTYITTEIRNGFTIKRDTQSLNVVSVRFLSTKFQLEETESNSIDNASGGDVQFQKVDKLKYLAIEGLEITGLNDKPVSIMIKWRDQCGISASKDETFDIGGKRFTISDSSGTISGYAILEPGINKLTVHGRNVTIHGLKFSELSVQYEGGVKNISSVSFSGSAKIIISNRPCTDSINESYIIGAKINPSKCFLSFASLKLLSSILVLEKKEVVRLAGGFTRYSRLMYIGITGLKINGLSVNGPNAPDISVIWKDVHGSGISASNDDTFDLGGKKFTISDSSGAISGYAILEPGTKMKVEQEKVTWHSFKFTEVSMNCRECVTDASKLSISGHSASLMISDDASADSFEMLEIKHTFSSGNPYLTLVPLKFLSSKFLMKTRSLLSAIALHDAMTKEYALRYIKIAHLKIDGLNSTGVINGLDITMKWRDECGISASNDDTFDLSGKRFTISDSSGTMTGYAILGTESYLSIENEKVTTGNFDIIEACINYTGFVKDHSKVSISGQSASLMISNNPCADSIKTSIITNGGPFKNKSVALTVIPAKLLSSNVELIPGTTSSSAANGEFTRYSRLMYIGITGIKINGLKPDDADITMKWRDECGISASKDDTFDLGGKRFTISNSSGTISGYAILTSGAKLVAGSDKLSLRGFKFIRVRMHYTGCMIHPSTVNFQLSSVAVTIANKPCTDTFLLEQISAGLSWVNSKLTVLYGSKLSLCNGSLYLLLNRVTYADTNCFNASKKLVKIEIKNLNISGLSVIDPMGLHRNVIAVWITLVFDQDIQDTDANPREVILTGLLGSSSRVVLHCSDGSAITGTVTGTFLTGGCNNKLTVDSSLQQVTLHALTFNPNQTLTFDFGSTGSKLFGTHIRLFGNSSHVVLHGTENGKAVQTDPLFLVSGSSGYLTVKSDTIESANLDLGSSTWGNLGTLTTASMLTAIQIKALVPSELRVDGFKLSKPAELTLAFVTPPKGTNDSFNLSNQALDGSKCSILFPDQPFDPAHGSTFAALSYDFSTFHLTIAYFTTQAYAIAIGSFKDALDSGCSWPTQGIGGCRSLFWWSAYALKNGNHTFWSLANVDIIQVMS